MNVSGAMLCAGNRACKAQHSWNIPAFNPARSLLAGLPAHFPPGNAAGQNFHRQMDSGVFLNKNYLCHFPSTE